MAFLIYLFTGADMWIVEGGDLHVYRTRNIRSFITYRCQTKNLLTGETEISKNMGRLFITGKHLLKI